MNPADSLAITQPRLLKEFDAINNVGVDPFTVLSSSTVMLSWNRSNDTNDHIIATPEARVSERVVQHG